MHLTLLIGANDVHISWKLQRCCILIIKTLKLLNKFQGRGTPWNLSVFKSNVLSEDDVLEKFKCDFSVWQSSRIFQISNWFWCCSFGKCSNKYNFLGLYNFKNGPWAIFEDHQQDNKERYQLHLILQTKSHPYKII